MGLILISRFGNYFNQPVNKLPASITCLKFGYSFNQSINNLPSFLIDLILRNSFNQTVDRLPSSLRHLKLGTNFHQRVDNLPPSLTHLVLAHYSYSLNDSPRPLKLLKIANKLYHSVDEYIRSNSSNSVAVEEGKNNF